MVEPISLTLFAGASLAGMVFGRFSKNNQESVETDPMSVLDKPQNKVMSFVSIHQKTNITDLVAKAAEGETVFVNLRKLFLKPSKLETFLYELNMNARRKNLVLRQLSSELLILVDHNHTLNIDSLKTPAKGVNRAPEIIAQLNSIMAG